MVATTPTWRLAEARALGLRAARAALAQARVLLARKEIVRGDLKLNPTRGSRVVGLRVSSAGSATVKTSAALRLPRVSQHAKGASGRHGIPLPPPPLRQALSHVFTAQGSLLPPRAQGAH